MRFALALDVSLDEFLHPRGKKVSTKMPNRRVLRRMERIDSLPLHQQNHLLKTIDGFLKGAGVAVEKSFPQIRCASGRECAWRVRARDSRRRQPRIVGTLPKPGKRSRANHLSRASGLAPPRRQERKKGFRVGGDGEDVRRGLFFL